MFNPILMKIAVLGTALAVPLGAAAAQSWQAGQEIAGQTVQVQTNGVVNSVYFGSDGTATISGPGGVTVPATWSAGNNMLCLNANGARECWPYARPFQAGQQVALTSDCQQVSTFLAQMTNQPMPMQAPPPPPMSAGERG